MFRKIPIKFEILEPFQKLFLNQCCYTVSKLVEHLNFFENDPLHTSLVMMANDAYEATVFASMMLLYFMLKVCTV